MRISVVTVSFAAFGALLVGCSNIQDRQALPESGAASPISRINSAQLPDELAKPGLAARAAFESRLAHLGHNVKAVRLWTVNVAFGYLIGLDQSGKNIVDEIDVRSRGCVGPSSVKVDGSQNVWIGCQSEPSKDGHPRGASEQEYSSAGILRQNYKWTPCPVGTKCQALGAGDGGSDNRGHVFAEMAAAVILAKGVQHQLGAGFFWWRAGNPSGRPKFISLGANCEPICQPNYMDTDTSGNVWFTFIGIRGGRQGYGLGEITNPTTNPRIITIFPPNPFDQLSGVFTSNAGKTLNVVDTTNREIDQYELPVTPKSKPFKTFGPTLATSSNLGSFPTAGGFNKNETKLAIGDGAGWLDIGTVASNQWNYLLNLDFFPSVAAAAYTPSNK